jgi:heme/copper-type cytochrome/quinol oxidase subunit 2
MVKLLVVLVILLAVIAIAQLARVYEISSVLRKKKEEDLSNRDNRMNAGLLLLFMVALFASFIYLMYRYGQGGLPVSGSYHGDELDALLNFNWIIIIAVFFITNFLLFWFCFKYYYRADRKAYWFPHDNKLELIWTVVPAVVLAVIIIFGLKTWQDITNNDVSEDANPLRMELYAKQFDWTARYGGVDTVAYGEDSVKYEELGNANYLLITNTNPLGVITEDAVDNSMAYYESQIDTMELRLLVNDSLDKYSAMAMALTNAKIRRSYIDFDHGGHEESHVADEHAAEEAGHHGMAAEGDDKAGAGEGNGGGDPNPHTKPGYHFNYDRTDDAEIERLMKVASKKVSHYKRTLLSNPARAAMEERLAKFKRFRARLFQTKISCKKGEYNNGSDDIIVKGEFYLPKNKEVDMVFRSRDVLHSVYMPHFRVQMNCVPGITTPFRFTPKYTTEEMREITGDPKFDYILLCNKICGASHYNMWMTVKVVERPEFDQWLKDKNRSDKRFEAMASATTETVAAVAEVEVEVPAAVVEGDTGH